MGNIIFQKEMYDSALIYFEKSLTVFENTANIASTLNIIGRIYSEKGDYNTAIKYHQEALEMAVRDSFQVEIVQILLGFAETYKKQGNPRLAINYFDRAKTIAEESGFNYELKVT